MRFGLGATVAKAATTMRAFGVQFLKDNLKIYFDFKSSRAKTLEFVGTGSHYFTSSHYITTTYSLGTASGFTFAFWMQDSALTQADNYMDNRDSASDGVTFFGSSTNEMTFRINGNDVESSNDLTTGWNHIVGTYDGAIKTIYVNGIATSNAETSSINVTANLVLGARGYSTANYIEGYMKNCAVWERALSASEVQNIMYKTYSDLKGTETTHLKAWWSMDSQVGSDGNAGSGHVLDEVSGAGSTTNLGTVSGATLKSGIYAGYSPRKPRGFDNAPEAQADPIGSGSALFNGDADYIELGNQSGDLRLSGSNGTVSAWILLPDVSAGDDYKRIVDKSDAGSGENGYTMWVHTDGITEFQIDAVAGSKVSSSTAIADGVWTHLAASWDGTTIKFYQNGILEDSATNSTQPPNDSTGMRIGSWNNATPPTTREFQGNIAQVGVFDEALTQEQIQSIKEKTYSDLTTSEKTNLVSWWGLDSKFGDETQAAVVPDNNGALGDELLPALSTSNYTGGSDLTLSMDGNELNVARDGSSDIDVVLASPITLETNTNYLFEIEIGAGSSSSGALVNVRADESALGSTTYFGAYIARLKKYAIVFTSDGSATGFFFQIIANVNSQNFNIVSISLKKITSGNYGTLI